MQKAPFKPYQVDIWSNERYNCKETARHYGQIVSVKITENISENMISSIIEGCAIAHFHDNNSNTQEAVKYSFGYEIREIPTVPFLVVLHSTPRTVPEFSSSIIVMAIDEEAARTKTEIFLKINDPNTPVPVGHVQYKAAMKDIKDIKGFTKLSAEEFDFLTKRTSLVSFILND